MKNEWPFYIKFHEFFFFNGFTNPTPLMAKIPLVKFAKHGRSFVDAPLFHYFTFLIFFDDKGRQVLPTL